MLIDHRGRLRAAVAIRAVEIEGGDAMLAKSAFEYSAAADRCGYVISHTFTVPLLPVLFWDKRCATLEQDTLFRQPEDSEIFQLIRKPFTTSELVLRLEAMLLSRSSGSGEVRGHI